MFMFSKNFLSFLFEFWMAVILIIVILICKHTSWLVFPTLLCIAPPVLFATVLAFAVLITLITPDGNKQNILLPLINFCLLSTMDIKISGLSLSSIENGSIIIVNYPSNFVEYALLPSLLHGIKKQTRLIVGANAVHNAAMFFDSSSLIGLEKKDNYVMLKNQLYKDTNTITIVYPEYKFWNRETIDHICPFRSGIIKIAQELNKRVFVVRASHIAHTCGYVTSKTLHITLQEGNSYEPTKLREQMINM